MLTYLPTSLFDSPARALVNPVNTVGVMGKGLALAFKQRYPAMYQDYRRLCQAKQFDIGCLHLYPAPDRVIINFPTKKHWRDPSRVDYIEAGLVEFVRVYEQHSLTSVALPQLGCGHGGLNWERQVRPVMEKYLQALSLPVYIHLVTPGRAS